MTLTLAQLVESDFIDIDAGPRTVELSCSLVAIAQEHADALAALRERIEILEMRLQQHLDDHHNR